jgi:hypothetical protein
MNHKILFWIFIILLSSSLANATNYYVCNNANDCNAKINTGWNTGSDSNNCLSKSTSCQSLGDVFSKMSAGDELIIGDGTYTGDNNKIDDDVPDGLNYNTGITGANGDYTYIHAENDHEVTLDGEGQRSLLSFLGKSNIKIEGIRFVRASNGMGITNSKYITFKTCAFHSYTNNKYGKIFGITAIHGDYETTHSSYILVEDSWFWGNGRYSSYAHFSDHVTYRRNVFRTDGAEGSAEGEPTAGLSIYSASDNIIENNIVLDTTDPSPDGGEKSGFYTTISSCTGNPSVSNNEFYGNIAINIEGQAFQQDPKNSCGINYNGIFENNVAWDSTGQYSIYTKNIKNHLISKNTFGKAISNNDCSIDNQGGGHVGSGGEVTWTNNLFFNNNGYGLRDGGVASNNNAYNNNQCSASFTNYGSDFLNPGIEENPKLKYLPDASITTDNSLSPTSSDGEQIGAVIRKRYNQGTLSNVDLWPFPNEEWIKEDFSMYSSDAVRDWTSTDKTLSEYVWEYLGNDCPEEICDSENQICNENWVCGDWNVCQSGTQTKTCSDSNNCGTINNRPPISRTCLEEPILQPENLLFFEGFEDNSFTTRGWYDNTNMDLSTTHHIVGSTSSLEFHWNLGDISPIGQGSFRHLFDETDNVKLSFWVKYSEDYIGMDQTYGPHEFYFMTNKNGAYDGPATSYLTTYVEHNLGYPILSFQDALNIDSSKINVDLISLTENRAIAGCNGQLNQDYHVESCYKYDGVNYRNGVSYRSDTKYFSGNPGSYYKNDWHFVEAYFQLNNIVSGIGQTDGKIKYWYDGVLVIDQENIIMRSGEHPDMKFNQFLIGPFVGEGAPVDQTMWIDNLSVSTNPNVESNCIHVADNNPCDGNIDRDELKEFIKKWIFGDVFIADVIEVIGLWKI